jgi:galactose-1-phosphate uridylyltransferase
LTVIKPQKLPLSELFAVNDFGAEQVAGLSDGLQRVFAYYRENAIYSFNASLFFGPAGRNSFSCHFRIAARTFLNMRDFASDMSFHQMLLAELVSVVMPEQVAADMKHYFKTC